MTVLAAAQSRSDFTVFINYFAHRDKLKIEIYPVGWDVDRFNRLTIESYLPSLDRPRGLNLMQARAATKLIRSLSHARRQGL